MTDVFRVLTVCTANICRSPAAARLIDLRLSQSPGIPTGAIGVSSAGTSARTGSAACDLSSALVGDFVARTYAVADPASTGEHESRPVTVEMIRDADLILTLDRDHRAALAQMSPRSRDRTFTLRQAVELAVPVAEALSHGLLPEGAPPMPDDPVQRLRWFVAELDAARGIALRAHPELEGDPEGLQWHAFDIPDPHVHGYQIHPMVIELIEAAVITLCDAIDKVLTMSLPVGVPR